MTDIETKIYIMLGRGEETYIRAGEEVKFVLYTTGIRVRYYAISQQVRNKRFFLMNTDKKQIVYYVMLEQDRK